MIILTSINPIMYLRTTRVVACIHYSFLLLSNPMVDGQAHCFEVLVIMNKVFVWTYALISLEYILRSRMAGWVYFNFI